MEVSDTRTDVATSLVITLFLIDPLCFDVAKAYDKLEHTATCSECELLIDAFEEIIDTVRKSDGALEDIQKLRLISEVQFVALKVSCKSIRLQNREFKDYIEEIKSLNEKKFLTPPSPSKTKKRNRNKRTTVSPVPGTSGGKQRATGIVCCGNTTPPPPPADDEGNLSVSMGEESVSDLSNSDTEITKDTPRVRGILPQARVTSTTQRTKDFPSSPVKRKLLPSSLMQAVIQPNCSTH
ncbi:hypothetical protein TNCV_2501311 [Trichonephila clavipes]|nr:hypothetical protein TNCV_2501311 [Trichonephila clavipes]